MTSCVLDASAVLIFLRDEPGSDRVAAYLSKGTLVSAVNWAEVLSKLSDIGLTPQAVEAELEQCGVLGEAIAVVPFTQQDAANSAALRQISRQKGLSLGDRACLSLAISKNLPAVSADRSWRDLPIAVSVEIVR